MKKSLLLLISAIILLAGCGGGGISFKEYNMQSVLSSRESNPQSWNAGVPMYKFHSQTLATADPMFQTKIGRSQETGKVVFRQVRAKWFFGAKTPMTMRVLLKRERAVIANLIAYYKLELRNLYKGRPGYMTTEIRTFQANGNPCIFLNIASKGVLKYTSVSYGKQKDSDKKDLFKRYLMLIKRKGKDPVGWHDIKIGIIQLPSATLILRHTDLGYKQTFIKIMKKMAATFKYTSQEPIGEEWGKLVYRSVSLNDSILKRTGWESKGYDEYLIFKKGDILYSYRDTINFQRFPRTGGFKASQVFVNESSRKGIVIKRRSIVYRDTFSTADFFLSLIKEGSGNEYKGRNRIYKRNFTTRYKGSLKLLDYPARSKVLAQGGSQKLLRVNSANGRLYIENKKISNGICTWGINKWVKMSAKIKSDGTFSSYKYLRWNMPYRLVYAKSLLPLLKSFTVDDEGGE